MKPYQTRKHLLRKVNQLIIVIMALVTIILFQIVYVNWIKDQRKMMENYAADLMGMQNQDPNKDWTDLGCELAEKGLSFIGNDSMYLPH